VDLQIACDYEALSTRAAALMEDELRRKPDLVLVAAAGETPRGPYRAFAERLGRSAPRLRLVKLDEWGGLGQDDPASCDAFVRRSLVEPLGISEERYLAFDGAAPEPARECARVSAALGAWGGADLAVLGLGLNGPLGLIEPAALLAPAAHVATLSETSLRHSMLRHARRPTHGLTLGIAELLAARHVLLLVAGAHKRETLARLRRPGVTTELPASLLWLHPRVTCLCDEAAA
jgi:galactosamine-6-phosphate isomerase